VRDIFPELPEFGPDLFALPEDRLPERVEFRALFLNDNSELSTRNPEPALNMPKGKREANQRTPATAKTRRRELDLCRPGLTRESLELFAFV
jgi:hypothetical protein